MSPYPWLEQVSADFRERLESGRQAHALILSGPAGTGKAEFAHRMVTTLLCQKQDFPACGECQSCRWMASGAHPDFTHVSFELNKSGKLRSEIVVDQIRALIASLQLTATVSPRKGAVIVPADAMNVSTANALLKTLEEPPGDTVLVLVTDSPARLPATIRSRCQSLPVRPPASGIAARWLVENCKVSEDEARTALQAAAGSPLAARELIREGSSGQYAELVVQLDALQHGKPPGDSASAIMDRWLDSDPARLWTWLSLHAAQRLRQTEMATPVAARLSQLQSAADRNRALMATQVRKELLLQDWLIQWSELRL